MSGTRVPGRGRKRAVAAGGLLSAGVATALGIRRWDRADHAAAADDPRVADFTHVPPTQERTVVSADGTALHVKIYGEDDLPTVVLLHGWTCSADFWTAVTARLDGQMRVVAYDLRGHGRSAAPKTRDGYSTDALADDLLAVLTATVRPGTKAVVAGHSMGGLSIVAFAGRHPASVREMVSATLLASTGTDAMVAEAAILPTPAAFDRARALIAPALISSPAPTGGSSPMSRRVLHYIAFAPGASPAQVAFGDRIVSACPPRVRGGWGRVLANADVTDGVVRLGVPAIVLVGTADRLTPPVHATRLAKDLPHLVDFVELPDVGHMTPIEAPDVVTDLILRLDDAGAASA